MGKGISAISFGWFGFSRGGTPRTRRPSRTLPNPSGSGKVMWKNFVYLILLLSVAVFAAGFFSPPKVKGRVEVEGVSLQGKTEGEARKALSPLFSAWEKRTLTLLLPDGTGISVSAPQLAVKTDFDSVFQTALKVKKGDTYN